MSLHLHKKWPHSYGFEIYGNGPCYVISVEKGSIAHKAGLLPGDQLLGVNGQDVTNMSTGKIKVLAKAAPNQPPELEVVSCLKTHVIKPSYALGYGFKVANKRPVIVESVDYNGSAHHSGLRVGDIILEVSSPKTASADTLAAVLSQRPGKLTIQTIPVARTGNMVQVDKDLSKIKAPDSRLYKAKDIHKKLENLMGNDHIRKMAVVGALKQYAEDRDITILCNTLGDVLTTQAHRKILTQIRQLIPPAQRAQFDDLINFSRNVETSLETYKTRTAHNVGRKKLIRVQREADSFGFVIKSSCPAYIESVEQGGAAEKVGLQPGDYLVKLNGIDIRKCDHERLVQLIQDSGSAPTFEILRCAEFDSIKSVMSSSSSSSSHSSVNSVLFNNTVTDKEGNTFIEKVNFLLTAQEWKNMKKAIKTYEMDSDITELYSSVSALLDTPTKRTLWPFLFVILSSSHREYVSHHVKESFEDQLDTMNIDGSHHSHDIVGEKLHRRDLDMSDFPPYFKQQINFLLTSRERLQLKHSLKEYNSNHSDLNTLVNSLESILDTPSKKILWRMVLTQLTDDDRETLKERAGVLNNWKTSPTLVSSVGMDSYIGSPVDNATNKEADILYGRNKPQLSRDSDSSSDERESTDSSNSPSLARDPNEIKYKSSPIGPIIAKEHEETKKTAQYAQHVMKAQEKYVAAETAEDDKSMEESQDGVSDHHYVTIIPVGYPGLEKKLPFYNQHMTSPQLSNLRKTTFNSNRNVKTSKGANVTLLDIQHALSSSSDNDSDKGVEVVYDLTDSKYTRKAFNAQSAELPTESAAFRTSQVNSSLAGAISDQLDSNNSDNVGRISRKEDKRSNFMPPTPPPLPSALTLSSSELGMRESSNRMSVKRINWEKLDNKSVQNTIWEKLNDQDFSDMIHYLELETRFSTKPAPHKDYEARKEVHIMDKKKAYNISILLGHLKMSVTDMKQALYDMNENTLSADLLGQLLAFVPSEQEVSQYRMYTGELSLLTKPDQFAYQMSLVDNYEGRLKALWLKAIFKEKVEDIKKNLHDIKIASLELRNSKKLAQLLEAILAMGNYMNRGNARVGEAAGFRITFLTQLDVTKTADKKSSFLHVLADAAYNRFPEVLTLSSELATIEKAARVSIQALMQEIQSLQKSIEGTSAVLERISNQAQGLLPRDRFQEVISQFLVGASAELENIFTLQASSVNEFSKTVTFFGEDPKILTSQDVFGIFSEFIKNLEMILYFENVLVPAYFMSTFHKLD